MKLFIEHEFSEERIWNVISNINEDLLNIIDNDNGFNLLHASAYYGLDDLFLKINTGTQNKGLSVTDKKGRTPLHHIASNGRNNLLKTLLNDFEQFINIEQKNAKGRTVLHSAAKHLQLETVQLLVQAGADVNTCDNDNHTPLSLSYHRHYPGEKISINNSVYDYLLERTNYWQKMSEKYHNIEFTQDKDILISWLLGLKFVNNPNWLPGIKIEILTREFVVSSIYQTKLSKFVVLEDSNDKILLCIDKTLALEKEYDLENHVSFQHINSLRNSILQNIRAEHIEFTQIWGMELAGIDAQILASEINFGSEKQKLILINSPGLPDNLQIKTNRPSNCIYLFSHDDKLHLQGDYAWSRGASFYLLSMQNDCVSIKDNVPTYKKRLQQLKQKKLNLSADQISSIRQVSYTPGQSYHAEESTVAVISPQQIMKELFESKSKYLKNANSQLINYARFEYCAHGISYLHLPNGSLVNWWDTNALMQNQIAISYIPLKRIIHHEGLYCYLLQYNQELVVMFQGTDPGDKTSILRDLDRSSAGVKQIRHKYLDIIFSVANELKMSSYNEIKLFICGHSLGGGDAQNFFAAFLAYLASQKTKDLISNKHWMKFFVRDKLQYDLNKIKEVHLYAYNSSGIRNSSAELAKAAACRLEDLTITINHQRVQHDIVNVVGETMLHEFNSHDIGVRNLFFSGRSEFIDQIKNAHTDEQFVNKTIGEYRLYEGLEAQDTLKDIKCEPNTDKSYNVLKKVLQIGNFS